MAVNLRTGGVAEKGGGGVEEADYSVQPRTLVMRNRGCLVTRKLSSTQALASRMDAFQVPTLDHHVYYHDIPNDFPRVR